MKLRLPDGLEGGKDHQAISKDEKKAQHLSHLRNSKAYLREKVLLVA